MTAILLPGHPDATPADYPDCLAMTSTAYCYDHRRTGRKPLPFIPRTHK